MKAGLYARVLTCLLPLLFLSPTSAPAQRPELIVQTGHSNVVSVLAFSPDGSVLASGSGDNSLRLWDVSTGNELHTLDGHTSAITTAAFNSDGTLLASGSMDGTVRIWDATTGRLLRVEMGPAISVQWVQFTAGNKLLALGGAGKFVKQWTVGEADEALTFPEHPDVIAAATLTTDAKLMASGSQDGTVKIWDVAAIKELHTLKGFAVSGLENPGAGKLAFSPDKRTLAYIDLTRLRLWPAAPGAKPRVLGGHPMPIASFAFSPEGDLIATAGNDNTVKIWKVADGALVHTLRGYTDVVFSVAFNPASKTIAGGSGSWLQRSANEIKLWSTETGRELRSYNGRASGIKAVSFSADGKSLATHGGEAVKFWNKADGLMSGLRLPGDPRMTVTAPIAFSPDHKLVASRVGEGPITIREAATGREVLRLSEEDGARDSMVVTPLVFSPDGKYLARGNSNGEITLADLVRRDERKIPAHSERVRSLAFSPDSELLASGGDDGTIQIRSTDTYAVTRTLDAGHFDLDKAPAAMRQDLLHFETQSDEPLPNRVLSVAFKDNKTLASGSYSGVTLWDARAGERLASLSGHTHYVSAVSFSLDGRTLASGSWDKTIKLWDVASQKEMGTLAAHVSGISSLAFSPADPRLLVSGSSDTSVRLWDVVAREELASLITLNDADWLVTTPAGLFDGSPAGWKQVLWRFSAEMRDVLPVESFFNELYRPGLLAELARGERPQPRPGIDLNRLDRRQPRLKLTLAGRGPAAGTTVASHNVRLRLDVAETPKEGERARGSGARDVRLFRNGSLVKAWRGDALAGRASTVLFASVPVEAGENSFTAYAFNHDNVKSEDAQLSVTGSPGLQRKGTAYVLSVGVDEYQNRNYNLNYAVTDARAFAEELRRLQEVGLPAELRRFSRVVVVPLHNEQATKNSIMLALRRLSAERTSPLPHRHPLSGLRPAEPEDAVVVYFAGHGKATDVGGERDGGRFYLIPHDMGYDGPRARLTGEALETVKRHSISDRELEAAFEQIGAGQLLLVIDACDSGEALESEEWRRGPMNSRGLAQLAYEKGMYVLTASQGYQAAKESSRLGHGLLTYALVVEGLRGGAADADADGRVLAREWLDFAARRVPQLQLENEEGCRGLRADVECASDDKQELADRLRAQQEGQRPRVFYRREEDPRPLVLTVRAAGR